MRIAVEDDGPGIAPDDLPNVFGGHLYARRAIRRRQRGPWHWPCDRRRARRGARGLGRRALPCEWSPVARASRSLLPRYRAVSELGAQFGDLALDRQQQFLSLEVRWRNRSRQLSAAITRWHGTMIDGDAAPFAEPTAREAFGRPMRRASST